MAGGWDRAAEVRRRQIESGLDLTFSRVFVPYYVSLVSQLCPASMLEVGCGTGHLSAILSEHISAITSLEPSADMHTVAQSVLEDTNVELLNRSIQDYSQVRVFDLVISHMCLQAVDDLNAVLGSVRSFMHARSLFVFAIPHPCFYNDYKCFFDSCEYSYMKDAKKHVSLTITRDPDTKISGVPYNHRPLSRYFGSLKSVGFRVADFEEIFPTPEIQQLYGKKWGVPRYCVFHALAG